MLFLQDDMTGSIDLILFQGTWVIDLLITNKKKKGLHH
jgi:hypothetical protein